MAPVTREDTRLVEKTKAPMSPVMAEDMSRAGMVERDEQQIELPENMVVKLVPAEVTRLGTNTREWHS